MKTNYHSNFNGRNVVSTLAPSFLIGSSLFWHITAWMNSNIDRILPLTAELPALERLKNQYIILLTLMSDWIFFIRAGNKDNYKVSDEQEFRPDPRMDCGVSCP